MIRSLTVAAAAFALVAGAAAASEPNTLIAQDSAKPLTLTIAKHQVTDWLKASGHSALHVGEAEFDRQGTVKVEVDNGALYACPGSRRRWHDHRRACRRYRQPRLIPAAVAGRRFR